MTTFVAGNESPAGQETRQPMKITDDERRLDIVDAARALEGSDEVQFDEDAHVVDNECDGYWVACWHFFTREELAHASVIRRCW